MIYAILKMMAAEKNIRKGLAHFRIDYDETALKGFLFYMEELMRWNKKINLTGIQNIDHAVQELLYDAFFLKRQIQNDYSILDLGSGGGILGIPLSIMHTNTDIFSLDKSLRKIQFQRHIKRMLHLDRFIPMHGRTEEMASIGVDSLVVKAFGSITEILGKGGIHIKPGGRALILKGEKEKPVEREGFLLEDTVGYELPVISKRYKLFIYKKVS
jgi:16S rRNA (guanine527-N7)-methyltransferase